MIDVRKLRILTALDRRGTLAAVAEELHLTPPAVSMQLAALERDLGLALTERRGRRLALTPAGRVLAMHGTEVMDRLALAELEIEALRQGSSGTYRIAAFPSAARSLVADAWQRVSEEGAMGLRLIVTEPESAVAALHIGEADIAVVHAYSNVPRSFDDGITRVPLATEPVLIAVPDDDQPPARIDLADLAGHGWIAPPRALTCFEMTQRACGLAGFTPQVVAESADFAASLALVAAGAGVCLVPRLAIGEVPRGVHIAEPVPAVRRDIIAAVRTPRRGDPGIERLLVLLADAATASVEAAATH